MYSYIAAGFRSPERVIRLRELSDIGKGYVMAISYPNSCHEYTLTLVIFISNCFYFFLMTRYETSLPLSVKEWIK